MRDVDAELLLAGAGRGRHGRRVVAQAPAAVARLEGQKRQFNVTELCVCVCERTRIDLADVDGRHLRGTDGRVTRRVGERLARPDGELLLLLVGHDLLGHCDTQVM